MGREMLGLNIELKSLIIKEFLALWRDKKTRISLIAPPIVQLFIFTYAATLEVDRISLAVYDRDQGQHSIELLQRLSGSKKFSRINYVHSSQELKDTVTQGHSIAGMEIPSGFSKEVTQGRTGKVGLYLDGRNSNASLIVAGYIGEIITSYNADILQSVNRKLPNVTLVDRVWFNPNLHYSWFTIPSLIAILGMLIALIVTSLSVAREREMGTFEQLLVSPLSPRMILIGKSVPAFVIAFLECGAILAIAEHVLGLEFQGSYLLAAFATSVFLLAIIGCGLFISSLCTTQQQAVLGTFLFMNPSVILSGFAAPIENMPQLLQYVTYINPISYYMEVVKGVYLKDMSSTIVFMHTWPNILIALVTLGLAGWLFRKRML